MFCCCPGLQNKAHYCIECHLNPGATTLYFGLPGFFNPRKPSDILVPPISFLLVSQCGLKCVHWGPLVDIETSCWQQGEDVGLLAPNYEIRNILYWGVHTERSKSKILFISIRFALGNLPVKKRQLTFSYSANLTIFKNSSWNSSPLLFMLLFQIHDRITHTHTQSHQSLENPPLISVEITFI